MKNQRIKELAFVGLCGIIFGGVFFIYYDYRTTKEPSVETPITITCSCTDMRHSMTLEEAVPVIVAPRYGFTKYEIRLLAQLLCGDKDTDGDGEYDIDFQEKPNYYEVSKVLCVVMNRVRDERFPDTVKDVLFQEGQFVSFPEIASVEPSEKALKIVKEWCQAYDRYDMFTQSIYEDHVYFIGDGITNTTRSE